MCGDMYIYPLTLQLSSVENNRQTIQIKTTKSINPKTYKLHKRELSNMLRWTLKKCEVLDVRLDLSFHRFPCKLVKKNIMKPRCVCESSGEPNRNLSALNIRSVTERINNISKPHIINLFSEKYKHYQEQSLQGQG